MISNKKTSNEIKQKIKQERRKDSEHWKLQHSIDSVDQAVDFLVARLDQEMTDQLQLGSKDDALVLAYRHLGMFVRAKFDLWQKRNINLLRSCGDEDMFADTASGIILEALISRLRKS